MKKLLTLTLLLAVLSTPLLAQQTDASADTNIDTVIIASTANYPDALVASAASEKEGIPILLTKKDGLTGETKQALSTINPSEIVIVGGELVVSSEVESELRSSYDSVVRLSGTSRYGTAADIASYFWPEGSDTAVLVENEPEDDDGHLLTMARGMAIEQDSPVLLRRGSFALSTQMNVSGGNAYYAMLHYDNGDGQYNFPGDDNPVKQDGEIVMDRFTVEAAE
jgi:putative cell wall-binding protein